MSVDEKTHEPIRYGGWGRPDRGGVGKLSLLATMLLIIGPIFAVLLFVAFRWVPTLVYLSIWAAVMLALSVRDRHKRTVFHRLSARLAFMRAKASGANIYRSGPLSRIPYGRHLLPGLLASTEVTEHEDAWGRRFGLINYRLSRHYAVVLACEPDGFTLLDEKTVENRVGQWHHWLSSLTDEPGLQAASVTIETAPDSGARLRREVETLVSDDAPDFARQMYGEIAATYPAGSAQVRAWVTLVYRGDSRRRRNPAEVALEVGTRLPALSANLQYVGAGGVARPVDARGLCELVRTAYDPATAPLLEASRAAGETPDLSWEESGPVTHVAEWDHYVHDSGVSRTWEMTEAPRGEIYHRILGGLLEPTPDVARKRVTLMYRPFDPATAAVVVERDRDKADFRVEGSRKSTARAKAAQRAAWKAADEEARGSALTSFNMLITATVPDKADLPDATAKIESLAGAARLRIRPVYGSQDSAFAGSLPLGVVLGIHSRITPALREAL